VLHHQQDHKNRNQTTGNDRTAEYKQLQISGTRTEENPISFPELNETCGNNSMVFSGIRIHFKSLIFPILETQAEAPFSRG
jgi:hypothetical protein